MVFLSVNGIFWGLKKTGEKKIGEEMLMTGGGLVVISLTPLEGPSTFPREDGDISISEPMP